MIYIQDDINDGVKGAPFKTHKHNTTTSQQANSQIMIKELYELSKEKKIWILNENGKKKNIYALS